MLSVDGKTDVLHELIKVWQTWKGLMARGFVFNKSSCKMVHVDVLVNLDWCLEENTLPFDIFLEAFVNGVTCFWHDQTQIICADNAPTKSLFVADWYHRWVIERMCGNQIRWSRTLPHYWPWTEKGSRLNKKVWGKYGTRQLCFTRTNWQVHPADG